MNLNEMQVLCEKVFGEYTKEKWQNCYSYVRKLKDEWILARRWLNG
jgi:hypothetical protein